MSEDSFQKSYRDENFGVPTPAWRHLIGYDVILTTGDNTINSVTLRRIVMGPMHSAIFEWGLVKFIFCGWVGLVLAFRVNIGLNRNSVADRRFIFDRMMRISTQTIPTPDRSEILKGLISSPTFEWLVVGRWNLMNGGSGLDKAHTGSNLKCFGGRGSRSNHPLSNSWSYEDKLWWVKRDPKMSKGSTCPGHQLYDI